MALVNMRDMLYHAYHNGYAVGAFDLVSLDFLEGIMNAAERCRSPVILSLAESHFGYFDFELIMSAVETAARRARRRFRARRHRQCHRNSKVGKSVWRSGD